MRLCLICLGFSVAKVAVQACEDRPVSRLHPDELGGAEKMGGHFGCVGTGNLEVSKIMGVPPNESKIYHPSHE